MPCILCKYNVYRKYLDFFWLNISHWVSYNALRSSWPYISCVMKISLTLKKKKKNFIPDWILKRTVNNVKTELCHFWNTSIKQNCTNNDTFQIGFKQTLPLSSIGQINKKLRPKLMSLVKPMLLCQAAWNSQTTQCHTCVNTFQGS